MNKIILRAITAYSRTDLKAVASPISVKGREVTFGGKQYVVLEDDESDGHAAVYRCMNRGELKRLKRWPGDLTSKPAPQERKAMVPAILEISPVKTVPKSKQLNKVKDKNDQNQSDLFESQD
jgi:hypothetical protein